MIIAFLSRLVQQSTAKNVVNVRTAEITFQRSPGRSGTVKRGIEGLEFQVVTDGAVSQSGKTKADGKAIIAISGGKAELQLLHQGAPVASYEITFRDDAWEAKDTVPGVQRRLRALGHQLGHDGPAKDGITGAMNDPTDRAILEFQVDQKLTINGQADGTVQTKLSAEVGGTAV